MPRGAARELSAADVHFMLGGPGPWAVDRLLLRQTSTGTEQTSACRF